MSLDATAKPPTHDHTNASFTEDVQSVLDGRAGSSRLAGSKGIPSLRVWSCGRPKDWQRKYLTSASDPLLTTLRRRMHFFQATITQIEYAVEAIKYFLVVRDSNDGGFLLNGNFAQQVHDDASTL